MTTVDDQRRYRRVASGLFWAGFLGAFCAAIGAVSGPEKEVVFVGPNFWEYRYITFAEGLLWAIACLYPWKFRTTFRYIEGTVTTILAFSIISHFLFVLVLWSGGLHSSVYAATFLSLLGISLLVPEDAAIKAILFILVLAEAVALVLMSGDQQRHNWAILILSVIAYFFAAAVRWLLNRDNP
jgi:hypothetical protein